MLAVSLLLRSRGLRWPGWATWLVACAVVLAWDPWAWLQAGFWLSFVAVGLLMLWEDRRPDLNEDERGSTHRGNRWLRWALRVVQACASLWREQWRITLGLAPLTLLLFREVSLVGGLANLLAIPWVTLCVTPLTLLGVIAPQAWHLAALCLDLLRQVLAGMLAWGIPTWSVAAFPVWVAVAGVLGAGLCCLPAPVWLRSWGLPLLVPALAWQATPPPVGEVEVVAADVGQGQAVVLRTARHVLLYDAGPRYSHDMDAGQRVVVPLLQSFNARLDRLVLSHRDVDHTGGALSVLAMLAVLGGADQVSVFVRGTLVQLNTPDEMRGRVSSISGLAISASNELGEMQSGLAAGLFGAVWAVALGGIGAIVVTAAWAVLFPELRRAKTFAPQYRHAPRKEGSAP